MHWHWQCWIIFLFPWLNGHKQLTSSVEFVNRHHLALYLNALIIIMLNLCFCINCFKNVMSAFHYLSKKHDTAVIIGNIIIMMLFFHKHQHYWIKSNRWGLDWNPVKLKLENLIWLLSYYITFNWENYC